MDERMKKRGVLLSVRRHADALPIPVALEASSIDTSIPGRSTTASKAAKYTIERWPTRSLRGELVQLWDVTVSESEFELARAVLIEAGNLPASRQTDEQGRLTPTC
jgi:hypothetical protein